MGEINRLQLEPTDVGRGRTILGTAGQGEREQLEATRRAGQNALVATGLANQAIQTGQGQLEEATKVLESIDEEFGQARRTTEAIRLVNDTRVELDEEITELLQNENIEPENLARLVEERVLEHRNRAVGDAAALGQQLQAYVINKMGEIQSSRVSKARTTGFTREVQKKKGEYLRQKTELEKRAFQPTTSLNERQEIFNDIAILTDRYAFYLGEEAAQRLMAETDLFFREQQFTQQMLDNPAQALKEIDNYGFTPDQKQEFRDKAMRELEREHRQEINEFRIEQIRKQRKNDTLFEAAQQREAQGENPQSILADLRQRLAEDPTIADAVERYETEVRSDEDRRRGNEKYLRDQNERALEEPPSHEPTVRVLEQRAFDGDFRTPEELRNLIELISDDPDTFVNRTDSLRIQQIYRDAIAQGRNRQQAEISRAAKLLNANVRILGEIDRLTNQILPRDQLNAASVERRFRDRIARKQARGEDIDVQSEMNDFILQLAKELAPLLADVEFRQFSAYESFQEARNAGLTDGDEYERLLMLDTMLSEAAAVRANMQRNTREAGIETELKEIRDKQQQERDALGKNAVIEENERARQRERDEMMQKNTDLMTRELALPENVPELQTEAARAARFEAIVIMEFERANRNKLSSMTAQAEQRELKLTRTRIRRRIARIQERERIRQEALKRQRQRAETEAEQRRQKEAPNRFKRLQDLENAEKELIEKLQRLRGEREPAGAPE